MDQPHGEAAVRRHMTRVRIVALTFCASVFVYVLVGWLVVEMMDFTGVFELPLTITASIAVSQLVVILAGYLISRGIRNAAPDPTRAMREVGVDAAASPDVEETMQRYTKSVIVASALRDVAATIGFVLTLLTGELTWVLLLSGAALVSMLVHWPRRDAVQDSLQQQRLAR